MIDGLAVSRHGARGKPILLLSPGLGGSGRYFEPNWPALAADFDVVSYDHRGAGRSSRHLGGLQYCVEAMADDILTVLDGLDVRAAHIVGHAAGGVAGLELAARHPTRVSSLTVINGWASPNRHFARCMAIRKSIYEAGGARAYLKAQPLFLFPAQWIDTHLDELDRQGDDHAADFQSRETLFARIGALTRFDARGRLDAVACPTLLVTSMDDMLVPPGCTDELLAVLPPGIGEIHRFEHGGHAVNLTRQTAFEAALLSFLTRARPSSAN